MPPKSIDLGVSSENSTGGSPFPSFLTLQEAAATLPHAMRIGIPVGEPEAEGHPEHLARFVVEVDERREGVRAQGSDIGDAKHLAGGG